MIKFTIVATPITLPTTAQYVCCRANMLGTPLPMDMDPIDMPPIDDIVAQMRCGIPLTGCRKRNRKQKKKENRQRPSHLAEY